MDSLEESFCFEGAGGVRIKAPVYNMINVRGEQNKSPTEWQ